MKKRKSELLEDARDRDGKCTRLLGNSLKFEEGSYSGQVQDQKKVYLLNDQHFQHQKFSRNAEEMDQKCMKKKVSKR